MKAFLAFFHRTPKTREINLSNLYIASPCPVAWEKMAGDERVRHCSECNLNVYNLSAMTERQVQELIAASQGKRLCTRLYRRSDGTVLTSDCPWNLRAMKRKISRTAAAALTAIMSVSVAMAKKKPLLATCECSQSQQRDAGIQLTVTDQQGALIPKAEIKLENKSSKEVIDGVTGPAGEWREPKIAAGQYHITVRSRGFRMFSSLIDVRDGALLALKIKLPVADVNTTVEVKAEPVAVMGTVAILAGVHDSVPSAPISRGRPAPMRP